MPTEAKVHNMQEMEFDRELTKVGAKVSGKLSMAWFLLKRYPTGAVGLFILISFLLIAAAADLVTIYDPLLTNPAESLAPPGQAHLLGTDFMGRDLFSRLVYGARTSLVVGLGATALGVFLGVMVGLSSGYLGGWYDLVMQRLSEIVQTVPMLVLALAMAAALGPSMWNTILAIAIAKTPTIARVVRATTLSLREQTFVESARAIGMGELIIALRYVLPNTVAPIIVLATAGFGGAILTEASLSFLGLGVPEPYPSWGRMLSESAAEYMQSAPWLVIFPGLAISFVVFGTNLLGDALVDILDPRQRTSR